MAPKRKSQKRKHPKGFKLVKDIYSPSEIEALENDTHARSPMTISGGHESETLEESLSRIKRAFIAISKDKIREEKIGAGFCNNIAKFIEQMCQICICNIGVIV